MSRDRDMTEIPAAWVEDDVRRASVVDREALAHDLHDYGVCRELRWDGAGHDEAPPCDVLASHIIVFLASGAVQDAADVRRAVAEEIAAAIDYQLLITHEYDHDAANRPGLLCAARIAREHASPDRTATREEERDG